MDCGFCLLPREKYELRSFYLEDPDSYYCEDEACHNLAVQRVMKLRSIKIKQEEILESQKLLEEKNETQNPKG